jgi:hypothetical protein
MKEETITDVARRAARRRMLAQWDAAPPAIGDYLLTERGHVARLIVEVRKYEGSASYGGRPWDYIFMYQAVPFEEIPKGALVHSFVYLNKRQHRRPIRQ